MSIESLRADLVANVSQLANLSALSTTEDVVNHLKFTLWPFLENVTTEMAELDEVAAELYNQSEDILQPESAKLFAAAIGGAMMLIGKLEKYAAGDAQLTAAINEWKPVAKKAGELIDEIAIPEEEEEDEEDDDDDDDADEETGKEVASGT